MNNRINYIDQLKGLAILLVVMGHVAEISMNITATPFNIFKGSFHMPLFMFLSGIFAFKSFKRWSIDEILYFLRRKTFRIIFPFIIIGGVYSSLFCDKVTDVYLGVSSSFWFLPALFYCMLYALIVNVIINKMNYFDTYFGVLLIHFIWWAIPSLLYYNDYLLSIPFFLHAIKMYPFFVMGTLFSKYDIFKKMVINSNSLFSISIIGYLLCLLFQQRLPLQFSFTGIFAIIILINIFSNNDFYFKKEMTYWGRHSLEIYVFHWFLLPTLNSLGNWLSSQSIGVNENFIILFCITFIIAIPIIYSSIFISYMIKNSKFLNALCFGSFK